MVLAKNRSPSNGQANRGKFLRSVFDFVKVSSGTRSSWLRRGGNFQAARFTALIHLTYATSTLPRRVKCAGSAPRSRPHAMHILSRDTASGWRGNRYFRGVAITSYTFALQLCRYSRSSSGVSTSLCTSTRYAVRFLRSFRSLGPRGQRNSTKVFFWSINLLRQRLRSLTRLLRFSASEKMEHSRPTQRFEN